MFNYFKNMVSILMKRYRILNFMVVGAIGFCINMAIYYPLTLIFKEKVTILQQNFYLPPFIISSLIAIACNYYLNKKWTFGERKAKSMSFIRYESANAATVILDVAALYLLVHYLKIPYMAGAVLAVLAIFLLRYFIAVKWIWKKHETEEMA